MILGYIKSRSMDATEGARCMVGHALRTRERSGLGCVKTHPYNASAGF